MKYKLPCSFILLMSLSVSQVSHADLNTGIVDAVSALFGTWFPNIEAELQHEILNFVQNPPIAMVGGELSVMSDDELYEAVLALQTERICWYHSRVSCRNGNSCVFKHVSNAERQRLRKLRKEEKLVIRLKTNSNEAESTQSESSDNSNVEIVVEENGVPLRLEPKNKRCYFFGRVPCKNGDNCRFIHDNNLAPVEAKEKEEKRKKRDFSKRERRAWKAFIKSIGGTHVYVFTGYHPLCGEYYYSACYDKPIYDGLPPAFNGEGIYIDSGYNPEVGYYYYEARQPDHSPNC